MRIKEAFGAGKAGKVHPFGFEAALEQNVHGANFVSVWPSAGVMDFSAGRRKGQPRRLRYHIQSGSGKRSIGSLYIHAGPKANWRLLEQRCSKKQAKMATAEALSPAGKIRGVNCTF